MIRPMQARTVCREQSSAAERSFHTHTHTARAGRRKRRRKTFPGLPTTCTTIRELYTTWKRGLRNVTHRLDDPRRDLHDIGRAHTRVRARVISLQHRVVSSVRFLQRHTCHAGGVYHFASSHTCVSINRGYGARQEAESRASDTR